MDKLKDIKLLNVGDYIKVNQISGPVVDRFSFSGELLKIESNVLVIKTNAGTVGLPNVDIEIYKLKSKPPKKQIIPVTKPILTKKEQVFNLVKNNKNKNDSTLLKLAKREIGGNESALAGYIQLARNKLK